MYWKLHILLIISISKVSNVLEMARCR